MPIKFRTVFTGFDTLIDCKVEFLLDNCITAVRPGVIDRVVSVCTREKSTIGSK